PSARISCGGIPEPRRAWKKGTQSRRREARLRVTAFAPHSSDRPLGSSARSNTVTMTIADERCRALLLFLIMITKSTVLILGAGASKPFNFPTSAELRQILCDENTEAWIHIRDLVNDIVGPGRFERFVKLFNASSWMSVDTFLEHRSEWLE